MRLIDADKTIEMIDNLQCSNMEQRETICYVVEEIKYADTELIVEAIPIKWIERYTDSTLDEGNSQMLGFKAAIIKEMVEKWEKENE